MVVLLSTTLLSLPAVVLNPAVLATILAIFVQVYTLQ